MGTRPNAGLSGALDTAGHLVAKGLRRLAVGPFDLTLAPGDCCAVTGPSGVGKSVLLRMIADLDPHEGSVCLGELDRASTPAPAWRRMVTYVPAESGWWEVKVGDHFPSSLDVAPLMTRLGLPAGALDWPVSRLSTGERQRLAFLRAVLNKPRVLLLDEPTSALDPETTGSLEAICRELMGKGTIIVMVSHSEAQAARLATQRLHLQPAKEAAA